MSRWTLLYHLTTYYPPREEILDYMARLRANIREDGSLSSVSFDWAQRKQILIKKDDTMNAAQTISVTECITHQNTQFVLTEDVVRIGFGVSEKKSESLRCPLCWVYVKRTTDDETKWKFKDVVEAVPVDEEKFRTLKPVKKRKRLRG